MGECDECDVKGSVKGVSLTSDECECERGCHLSVMSGASSNILPVHSLTHSRPLPISVLFYRELISFC